MNRRSARRHRTPSASRWTAARRHVLRALRASSACAGSRRPVVSSMLPGVRLDAHDPIAVPEQRLQGLAQHPVRAVTVRRVSLSGGHGPLGGGDSGLGLARRGGRIGRGEGVRTAHGRAEPGLGHNPWVGRERVVGGRRGNRSGRRGCLPLDPWSAGTAARSCRAGTRARQP